MASFLAFSRNIISAWAGLIDLQKIHKNNKIVTDMLPGQYISKFLAHITQDHNITLQKEREGQIHIF